LEQVISFLRKIGGYNWLTRLTDDRGFLDKPFKYPLKNAHYFVSFASFLNTIVNLFALTNDSEVEQVMFCWGTFEVSPTLVQSCKI
jgi:hypothetical protein